MNEEQRDAEAWRYLTECLEMAGVDMHMLSEMSAYAAGCGNNEEHKVFRSLHDALARRAQP